MQNSKVKNNQRQLEGNTKTNLKHNDDAEIVFCLIERCGKLGWLLNEPAKCGVQNNEIAENHSKEEQKHHGRYRGNHPTTLLLIKCRKEKRHNFPDDNWSADNEGKEKCHLKADGKASKNRKYRQGTSRKKLSNGICQHFN